MIRLKSPAITLCVLFLVITAGCSAPKDVDVGIENISETSTNGEILFSGTLNAADQYEGQFVIENIHIVFLDRSGKQIHNETVGTITGTDFSYNVSVRIQQRLERIRIQTGDIKTEARVDIHNLRRNESGGWEYYR